MNPIQAIKGFRLLSLFTASLSLAALAGCGDSSKATISGKVTYKGAPVTGGTLTLYPAPGTPVPVNINANGAFNDSAVPVGPMGVSISTDNVPAPQGYQTLPGMKPPKDAPSPEPPKIDTSTMEKKVAIPAKYKDPKTSGLSWDIKGGGNPRDFELTD